MRIARANDGRGGLINAMSGKRLPATLAHDGCNDFARPMRKMGHGRINRIGTDKSHHRITGQAAEGLLECARIVQRRNDQQRKNVDRAAQRSKTRRQRR